MEIIEYSATEFNKLFPRMEEEFPASEMKNIAQLSHILSTGKYHCYTLNDNDVVRGMALGYLNEETSIFWLDYLQIFKENQAKGYGEKLLSLLVNKYKGIMLEVENPENDDYLDNKNARMRFYHRFNITKIDVPYLFPCNDGTTIELNLSFIPNPNTRFVSKEDLKDTIRGAVSVIHYDVPHAKKTMETYIDKVSDLEINYFTTSKVDMNNLEELKTIGELIYHVDPWVYPSFFDNSIERAREVAPFLLKYKTIYNHENIVLGRINGQIAGFMLILDKFIEGSHDETVKAMKDGNNNQLTPEFDKAMEGYFDALDYEWEGLQIVSLSVLPQFRRMHVGSKMLLSLDSHKTYSLACVRDNVSARKLYAKHGFIHKYDYPGYTGVPCVELVKKGR